MTNYNPVFSPDNFYRNGSSLWRWVKYGHGKTTPYVDPFSKDSLNAPRVIEDYGKQVNRRIHNLMTDPQKLPPEFNERASNFIKASENFPVIPGSIRNYPGDGYVFFMDHYFFGNYYPRHTNPKVFNFYNYLYSYRPFLTLPLFNYFTGLRNDINKIEIYYEHRSIIFKDKKIFEESDKYNNSKHYLKMIEFFLFDRLLGHPIIKHPFFNISVRLNTGKSQLLSCILTLLEGFTLAAVKRILFNQNATSQSVMNSVNLVRETCSLINRPVPEKYGSIAALQIFHDAEAENLLRKAREKRPSIYREYTWDNGLVQLIDSACEGKWYLPVSPIELIERGNCHHNCIGSYYAEHFKEPAYDTYRNGIRKTLILLSNEAEAEFRLHFEKREKKNKTTGEIITETVCSSCSLVQCKTGYNKAYPFEIRDSLFAAFKGCDIGLFIPSSGAENVIQG